MLVFTTASDGFTTRTDDRLLTRDEARLRGIAAGFTPEQVDAVLKRYRAA